MDDTAAATIASGPVPRPRRVGRELIFPIVEAFGFSVDVETPESLDAHDRRHCPFARQPCEKFRQYGFGYCSVTYAAADDGGTRRTYAVCDHRLDGPPIQHAIADYFKERAPQVKVAAEIVLPDPRTSFDFVAFESAGGVVGNAIAIEAQAIDIRGGGVGPAWKALLDKRRSDWRSYFTTEAAAKGRRDTVAYGVNMANIYKRLGLQVAAKGAYLKAIGIPLYVVMQDRPFRYLKRRIDFAEAADSQWDITFVTFDYTGEVLPTGELAFRHKSTVRTTLEHYVEALALEKRGDVHTREKFLEAVKRKAGLTD